ncbi:hypothetical protein EXQ30_10360, partial [Clostridium botulinum]|nr:hypothetical protein [Clostridium botulinum]
NFKSCYSNFLLIGKGALEVDFVPLSLKSYTNFTLLKRRICGVKGIRKSLEILICFLKIY